MARNKEYSCVLVEKNREAVLRFLGEYYRPNITAELDGA